MDSNDLNVDLWFGDSYTVGAELSYHLGEYTINDPRHLFVRPERDRPDYSYAHLVSTFRNVDYINFGRGGGSIGAMVCLLINFCKTKIDISKQYTAFFCLPPQERIFRINNQNYQFTADNFTTINWTDLSELQYNNHETTLLLNQLYLICKQYNISPKFLSQLSTLHLNNEYNLLPDDVWLINPTTTLVNIAWSSDNKLETWRDISTMLLNKSIYNEYIQPCENHPNIHGHIALANTILSKL